jgi:prepilin-type N-terminal cleavage/methylation domain-containing protein
MVLKRRSKRRESGRELATTLAVLSFCRTEAKFPPRESREAFTLIELLIVVAIIGILAAIAIPNFLEAQIRAKVARAKSDLRTLSMAVEIYVVDYDGCPLAADNMGEPIDPYPPTGFGPECFETRLAASLTTPIAYLTGLPEDPFASPRADPEDPEVFEGPGYHYGYLDYALMNDGPEGAEKFREYVRMLKASPTVILYFLSSHGPDQDHDDDEVLTDPHAAVSYDPTNGTASNGDIVYFGPGHGFAH